MTKNGILLGERLRMALQEAAFGNLTRSEWCCNLLQMIPLFDVLVMSEREIEGINDYRWQVVELGFGLN